MKEIVTAKRKSKKVKDLNKKTYEYFKLLYGPEYAKVMTSQDKSEKKEATR